MSMSLLTRDAILTADDLPFEDVPVPEWGGTVRVRTMSGAERDQYETQITGGGEGKRSLENVRAGLVARVVVDEEGHSLFNSTDVKRLGQKSAKALSRVAEVALRLSGLTDEDERQLAQDEIVEDFGDAPSSPSTTG